MLSTLNEPVLANAYKNDQLQVIATGSGSPCISFTHLSDAVEQACPGVDLVIIEGMGRAIHTNFYAKFSVDTVKIGSFKNPQAAAVLGAKIYDGLLLFEPIDP
jgi:type II pantothenate kinase